MSQNIESLSLEEVRNRVNELHAREQAMKAEEAKLNNELGAAQKTEEDLVRKHQALYPIFISRNEQQRNQNDLGQVRGALAQSQSQEAQACIRNNDDFSLIRGNCDKICHGEAHHGIGRYTVISDALWNSTCSCASVFRGVKCNGNCESNVKHADLQILLRDTLGELRTGVPVVWQRGQNSLEMWREINLKKALIVGFTGDFKTGKSFLLGRISGNTQYQHSLTESTIGLNVIFGGQGEHEKVYYVDPAGSGEPLQMTREYGELEEIVEGPNGPVKTTRHVDYWQLRQKQINAQFQKPLRLHKFEVEYSKLIIAIEREPHLKAELKQKFIAAMESEGINANVIKQLESQYTSLECILKQKALLTQRSMQIEVPNLQQLLNKAEEQIAKHMLPVTEITQALSAAEREDLRRMMERNNLDITKEKISLERYVCERFMQEFVTEMSSVLIVVVSRLSRQQETLIMQLYRMLAEKQNQYKRVVVLHNYHQLYLAEEIEQQIENDILHCYNVEVIKEKYNNYDCKYWMDMSISRDNPIVHLALGNFNSQDAGMCVRYRDFALEVVQRIIKAQANYSDRNLFEVIENYFSHSVRKYMRVEYEEDAVKRHEHDKQKLMAQLMANPRHRNATNEDLQLIIDEQLPQSKIELHADEVTGAYTLRGCYFPKEKEKFSFVRLPTAIEGETFKQTYSNQFTPRYNLSIFNDRIIVILDAAGLDRDDIKNMKIQIRTDMFKGKHILMVKGKRRWESNEVFKKFIRQGLQPDSTYCSKLIDFGVIDSEIELTDLTCSIDFTKMRARYVNENLNENLLQYVCGPDTKIPEKPLQWVGGWIVIMIPKTEYQTGLAQYTQIIENSTVVGTPQPVKN